MAKVETNATAKKFIKPDYIVATLYKTSDSDGSPTGDAFILEDIVGNSTSISQDDNETTDIDCETSDSPIVSIVKLGKWQVAAEVGDTQDKLLAGLCNFVIDETGKKVLAPSTYKKTYVKFDIVFTNEDGTTYSAFVVPKLQLNSKLTIESLNSNLGRIALAGTAQNIKMTVGESSYMVPFYVDQNYTLPTGA